MCWCHVFGKGEERGSGGSKNGGVWRVVLKKCLCWLLLMWWCFCEYGGRREGRKEVEELFGC